MMMPMHACRKWRDDLSMPGMFLKAASLEFTHPITGSRMLLHTEDWEPRWRAVFDMFGVCPVLGRDTGVVEVRGDGVSGMKRVWMGYDGGAAGAGAAAGGISRGWSTEVVGNEASSSSGDGVMSVVMRQYEDEDYFSEGLPVVAAVPCLPAEEEE